MKTSKFWLLALSTTVLALACSKPTSTHEVKDAQAQAEAEASPLPLPSTPPVVHRPAPQPTPASPDTRSPAQIAQAACETPGFLSIKRTPDKWRCQGVTPPEETFKAATSTPIIPSSWTVPNWFVNKTTGSDSNACTTSGSPCKTKQEIIVHRWGCQGMPMGCPRFRQATTLEQDASDTDNSDPFYLSPAIEVGFAGQFVIQGGPAASTAAVFTLNTAKNRGVGTNALLSGSFSAGAPAVGVMVQNTTAAKSSFAWIYKSIGGANWDLTQPLAPTTPSAYNTHPIEVDTWATNDTVNLLTPIAINIPTLNGVESDFSNPALAIYNATIFDPGGIAADNAFIGAVQAIQISTQRVLNYIPTSAGIARNLTNVFVEGGISASSGNTSPLANTSSNPFDQAIFGGAIECLGCGNTSVGFGSAPTFDGDMIIGSSAFLFNGGYIGIAFLDSTLTIAEGLMTVNTVDYGSAVIYGSGTNTINLQGSSHLAKTSGSNFQTVFTAPGLVTGIKLNGTATSNSLCTATINAAISTTPAHLDAACGAAGFGGAAYTWGGASVAAY